MPLRSPPAGHRPRAALVFLALAVGASSLYLEGCSTTRSRVGSRSTPGAVVDRGIASWYGPKFHGRRTANGERYNMHGLTAAHRTLPFGTWVEVTNLDNGRRVVVRINDRGPFVKGRVIDLSLGAARQLELVGPGTARVELRLLAAAGTSRYVVQVGAFTSRTRADLLAEDLWHRFQQVSVASDGAWHRVQVGPYGARGEAEEARRRLEDLGFTPLLLALPNEEPGGDFKGPARAASP